MASKLSSLTAEQLLQQWQALNRQLPHERREDLLKHLGDLRREIDRRIAAHDPDLEAIAAERLSAEAERRLLQPIPPGFDELTGNNISALTDRALKRYWRRCNSQLSFAEKSFPDTRSIKGWLEKATIESRKSKLKEMREAVAREMMRRGLLPDTSTNAKTKPQLRGSTPLPDVARRRSFVRRNHGLSAQQLCNLFDSERIPLVDRWHDVETWAEAYKSVKYRSRIQTLISKDKAATVS